MRGVSPMNKDKNQVTKLINKYAESYIYKEEENNQLKKTIKDLKVTLKYHKDMLNTLMSDMNLDDKMKLVMNQKKEESEYMTQKIDSLNKEVKEWRDKVYFSEKIAIDNINKEKNNLEMSEQKIFKLENLIEKKNNEMMQMKKKLSKFESLLETGLTSMQCANEIIVVEPCQAVNHINDELLMYKEVYNNLSESFKTLKNNIKSYEKTIEDLQYEMGNLNKELREKDKTIAMKMTKDNKISNINNINDVNNININTLNNSSSQNNKNNNNNNNENNNIYDEEELKQQRQDKLLQNLNYCINNDVYNYKLDTSEWREVIRVVGFNEEEYNDLFDTTKNKKAIDCLDALISIVLEKNIQIDVFKLENTKLNSENQVLFDETTVLKKQISILDTKLTEMKVVEEKYSELKEKYNNIIDCVSNYNENIKNNCNKDINNDNDYNSNNIFDYSNNNNIAINNGIYNKTRLGNKQFCNSNNFNVINHNNNKVANIFNSNKNSISNNKNNYLHNYNNFELDESTKNSFFNNINNMNNLAKISNTNNNTSTNKNQLKIMTNITNINSSINNSKELNLKSRTNSEYVNTCENQIIFTAKSKNNPSSTSLSKDVKSSNISKYTNMLTIINKNTKAILEDKLKSRNKNINVYGRNSRNNSNSNTMNTLNSDDLKLTDNNSYSKDKTNGKRNNQKENDKENDTNDNDSVDYYRNNYLKLITKHNNNSNNNYDATNICFNNKYSSSNSKVEKIVDKFKIFNRNTEENNNIINSNTNNNNNPNTKAFYTTNSINTMNTVVTSTSKNISKDNIYSEIINNINKFNNNNESNGTKNTNNSNTNNTNSNNNIYSTFNKSYIIKSGHKKNNSHYSNNQISHKQTLLTEASSHNTNIKNSNNIIDNNTSNVDQYDINEENKSRLQSILESKNLKLQLASVVTNNEATSINNNNNTNNNSSEIKTNNKENNNNINSNLYMHKKNNFSSVNPHIQNNNINTKKSIMLDSTKSIKSNFRIKYNSSRYADSTTVNSQLKQRGNSNNNSNTYNNNIISNNNDYNININSNNLGNMKHRLIQKLNLKSNIAESIKNDIENNPNPNTHVSALKKVNFTGGVPSINNNDKNIFHSTCTSTNNKNYSNTHFNINNMMKTLSTPKSINNKNNKAYKPLNPKNSNSKKSISVFDKASVDKARKVEYMETEGDYSISKSPKLTQGFNHILDKFENMNSKTPNNNYNKRSIYDKNLGLFINKSASKNTLHSNFSSKISNINNNIEKYNNLDNNANSNNKYSYSPSKPQSKSITNKILQNISKTTNGINIATINTKSINYNKEDKVYKNTNKYNTNNPDINTSKLDNMEEILNNTNYENDSVVYMKKDIKEFTFDSCTSAEFKKELENNMNNIQDRLDKNDIENLDEMSIRLQTANY